jgi:hypothetical protein
MIITSRSLHFIWRYTTHVLCTFWYVLQAKLLTAQSAAQGRPDLGEVGPLLGVTVTYMTRMVFCMLWYCLQAKLSTARSAAQSSPDLGEVGPLAGQ